MMLTSTIRRFEMADLTSHRWLIPRLIKAHSHLTERNAQGWLASTVYSNEYLFLRQDHSAALAQCIRSYVLAPIPVVQERFVFAESAEHIAEAAEFYPEMARWAKTLGSGSMIVDENTDVPTEMIRKKLGKLYDVTQRLAKVT